MRSSATDMCGPCITRRTALTGVAGATLALTGCSTYGDTTPASSDPPVAAGQALASVADVPVGGGIILADAKIVLTQPEAGTIKAFSAVCTHQGCAVTGVADGAITCPCHGSSFSVTDGAVLGGPAASPLPEQQVTLDGENITLA